MLMKVKTERTRPAAGRNGRPGRSAEFRRYMEELKITDPKRWAEINAAEDTFVASHDSYLQTEEALIADQMEGVTAVDDE